MTVTGHQNVYSPFDPSVQQDPYPAYRTLRNEYPVYRHQDPDFYVLSRFADVWVAVENAELFSSAQGLTFWPNEIERLGLAPTIVMLDPPRHTQLRRLISRGFTRTGVKDLEGPVRLFVAERIDEMERKLRDGGPVDLHRDFSSPIPTFVLALILGIPLEDRYRFDPWVRAMVELQDRGPDNIELSAKDAVAEMFAYFSDVIARRRTEPADDLVGALVAAEVDGDRLTDWDILGFCFVMVAGGNDTTGNLISNGVALLDANHSQRAALANDPSLIPNAIIEFLRLESSVQGLARTATRSVVLHGVEIPEGSKVMLMYAAANRDEREFGEDAERLNIRRHIQRHLGFAAGPHFCLGAALAQLSARIAFEELLARHPTVGVDLEGSERLSSPFTRGWVSLPATGLE